LEGLFTHSASLTGANLATGGRLGLFDWYNWLKTLSNYWLTRSHEGL